MKSAILVIDIQEDFTGNTAKWPFPHKDAEVKIQNIKRYIEENDHCEIIYIQYALKNNWLNRIAFMGKAIEGTPGDCIDTRLFPLKGLVFKKTKASALSNKELFKYFKDNDITTLNILGLDGTGCVMHTAFDAIKKGFKVRMISDCILALKPEKLFKINKKLQVLGAEII